MTVFGGMIAVSCIGSILVPAFFVMINVMKEWYYADGVKKVANVVRIFGGDLIKKLIDKIKEMRRGKS